MLPFTKTVVSVVPRPRNPLLPRRDEVHITLDLLRPLFACRQETAAETLGISLTTFKASCRQLGLSRWPYSRKKLPSRKSADKAWPGVEESGLSPSDTQEDTQTHGEVAHQDTLAAWNQPEGWDQLSADPPAPMASQRLPNDTGRRVAHDAWSSMLDASARDADDQRMEGPAQEPCQTEDDQLALFTGQSLQDVSSAAGLRSMSGGEATSEVGAQWGGASTASACMIEDDTGCTQARGVDQQWLAWYLTSSDESLEV